MEKNSITFFGNTKIPVTTDNKGKQIPKMAGHNWYHTAMGIHWCLFRLDEAHQHTVVLPCTPPYHQRIRFFHLQSDMPHDPSQQLPTVFG